ncbi:MAG TPA: hypothetical protein VMD30_13380, partial [Tepidisphaeraceae bacterium]|nr:hypothetical protein [Tepidisphaeraceae bacterium]
GGHLGPEGYWNEYWVGLLANYRTSSGVFFCPDAAQPIGFNNNHGQGNVDFAWSGAYSLEGAGSGVRYDSSELLNNSIAVPYGGFRGSSYGFNEHLCADATVGNGAPASSTAAYNDCDGWGFAQPPNALMSIASIRDTWEVPLFMDCTACDVAPLNFADTELNQPSLAQTGSVSLDNSTYMPSNLTGSVAQPFTNVYQFWRLCIARHGRAINICMLDGHAETVGLANLYEYTWYAGWQKYALTTMPQQ